MSRYTNDPGLRIEAPADAVHAALSARWGHVAADNVLTLLADAGHVHRQVRDDEPCRGCTHPRLHHLEPWWVDGQTACASCACGGYVAPDAEAPKPPSGGEGPETPASVRRSTTEGASR